jgi:purine-binding chemotaxis protein CheW
MATVESTSLPVKILTLALAGEAFALEAEVVREILDIVTITDVPNAPAYVWGLINVRGKVVPLVDLRVRFGLTRSDFTIDTRIVVIELDLDGEPTIVGLLADKVYEVTTINTESIEATPRVGLKWRAEFIRGIGRRGKDFLVILDIDRVFASDQQAFIGDNTRNNEITRFVHAG